MPSTKLKTLELASSIEELNARIGTSAIYSSSAKVKCNSATKLFKEAEKYRKENDEERAYIYYMKYADLIHNIMKMKDYKDNKDFFDKLLGKHNLVLAIEWAEKLSKSLDRRYKLMKEEIEYRQKSEQEFLSSLQKNVSEEKFEPLSSSHDINEDEENVENKSSFENSISPQQLYDLLNDCLIIDARSSFDYDLSHIKCDNCMNVSEDIIKPGLTGPTLEKQLPSEALHLWQIRQNKTYVVLLDWKSSYVDVVPQSKLYSLKESLTKWERRVRLQNTPLILEGGYENWLFHYPMVTTNPSVSIPRNSNKCDINEITLDFEYPDLDDGIQNNSNTSLVHPNFINVSVQKEELFPKFDRTNKPRSERNSSPNILERKNSIEMSETIIFNKDKEEPKFNGLDAVNLKPEINRSLKPKILDLSSEKENLDTSPDKIVEILSSVNENLKIEKEVNEQELKYNEIRLRREKEAEEAMKLELQKQEEILLEKIHKLELEKKEKEEERIKLLHENEEIKRRFDILKHESEKHIQYSTALQEKENFEQKQKLIQMKEKERSRLAEQTERLRQERKEKEKAKLYEMHKEAEDKKKSYRIETSEKSLMKDNKDVSTGDIKIIKLKDASDSKNQSLSSSRRSSLSRSHSSPNIVQMIADEETNASMKLPHFDRQVKPSIPTERKSSIFSQVQPDEYSIVRIRNLMPVYGNQGRALTGLRNLGNTCFMNSIIQCLAQTPFLASFFYKDVYRAHINRDNPFGHHGEIAEEFAIVIKALWAGQYRSIAPRDFKNTVSKFKPIFEGHEQQDSQEFLVFLMDGLHEDLNEVISRPTNRTQLNTDNMSDEVAAKMAWEAHSKLNKSFIVSLFQGQYKSTVQCLHCKKLSVTFDVFMYLSLPIPSGDKNCTLKDCLKLYIKEEKMVGESKWQCPRCKVPRDATKNIIIWKLPHVLLIHLKRFSYEGMWRQKIQTFVDFPLTISFKKDYNSKDESIFKDFVIGPKNPSTYSLYAVSNHYGTMEGGHYTAFCKNSESHRWYKFDDHEVTEMTSSGVNTSAAYILFYASINLPSSYTES